MEFKYHFEVYAVGDTGVTSFEDVNELSELERVGMIVADEQMYLPDPGEGLQVSRDETLGPNNIDAGIRENAPEPDIEPGEGELASIGVFRVLDRAFTIFAVDDPDSDPPAGGNGAVLLVEREAEDEAVVSE